MFVSYLIVGIRSILRNKFFSLLNILGLSVGIACAFLVYLYVNYELSFDRCYNDYERVFRVRSNTHRGDAIYQDAFSSFQLAPLIKKDFPEIESVTRFDEVGNAAVWSQDKSFRFDRIIKADLDFFSVFDRDFIIGSDKTLDRPNTCVITKEVAEIVFLDVNPLGKLFKIDSVDYEVVGVIENWPANSHINYDLILSYYPCDRCDLASSITYQWESETNTYLKLKRGVDSDKFGAKIKDIANSYNLWTEQRYHFLQPLRDIHLYSNYTGEIGTPGNIQYLYLFSIIGLIVLIIACINYMNLATAKYSFRSKEIGIRKTNGALRYNIVLQFLFESFIFSLIGHACALILVQFVLPFINSALNLSLSINLLDTKTILGLIILLTFTTFLAGSYPSFLLSSFRPEYIFKKTVNLGSFSSSLRKVLVVFQFAITCVLIVSVITVYNQMAFMKNSELGFEKENKLVVSFPDGMVNKNTYKFIKTEFEKISGVNSCSFASSIPGRRAYQSRVFLPGQMKGDNFMADDYYVDEDFFSVFKIELLEGDFNNRFLKATPNSNKHYFIINETAAKRFGWNVASEAIDKSIFANNVKIVGVTKDFHLRALHQKIEPMIIKYIESSFNYLILDYSTDDIIKLRKQVESKMLSLFPNVFIDCFFLDDDFNRQYNSEDQLGVLFSVLSVLGVFIACLGLLGLTSFLVEKRIKEIGVRKVYGATNAKIVLLLGTNFLKWILLSNLLAAPIAYYFLSIWLQGFAFHTAISVWSFLITALLTLIIAITTILIQALRAVKLNPIDILKYE